MITPTELIQARTLVQEICIQYNNDRDKIFRHITEICEQDKDLQLLFAKVGLEMYASSTSTKH